MICIRLADLDLAVKNSETVTFTMEESEIVLGEKTAAGGFAIWWQHIV